VRGDHRCEAAIGARLAVRGDHRCEAAIGERRWAAHRSQTDPARRELDALVRCDRGHPQESG